MKEEVLLYNLEEKIAELKEVNNALLPGEEELGALNKIGLEVVPTLSLQEILEKALDIVLSSMGLEMGFVFLLNEARDEFVLKAQQGMGGQFVRELVTMKAGYDFPAVNPELESLIVVQEISEYPRLGRFLRDREGFHSYISVPLSANGRLLGIMNIFSRGRTPNSREVNSLVTIGQQIGTAIENAQTFQKVVRAKREWEEIFDAITEGIFMLDEEFNILRTNIAFAKMLGTSPAKLIGQKCYRVLHDRDEPPDYCPKIETMRTGKPQTIEVREPTLKKDLCLSTHPLRDSRGSMVQIVQDITLRKQLETQLVQAEKLSAIGRLAQGIAHNLLTPLTVIRGRTQLVLEEARDYFEKNRPPLLSQMAGHEAEMPPDIAEVYGDMRQELQAIERGSKTMQEIIDNLMYKSRREQETHKQLVDINDLLWQELKFLNGDPRFKHYIEKVYNFTEEPLYIEGVYSDFSQSFSNLIKNAIDAMEGCEKPVLTITTRSDDRYVYIEFHDTGVGILPENIPHLFEPFFTTKPCSSSGGVALTGTGLGLHSCYQLLSPYGAQFEVKSQPGDTTFTVEMPRQ